MAGPGRVVLCICVSADSLIRAFPVREGRKRLEGADSPGKRKARQAGVGRGGVGNQLIGGCVSGTVLPRVGPVYCNSCELWNHQGWEARPQREWLEAELILKDVSLDSRRAERRTRGGRSYFGGYLKTERESWCLSSLRVGDTCG